MIPLPKEENVRGAHKIENFRGITLSPIISKVFEHCLIEMFGKYLYSSVWLQNKSWMCTRHLYYAGSRRLLSEE